MQLIGWNIYYSQGWRDNWFVVSKGITVGLTASVGLEQYKDDGLDEEEVGDGGDGGDWDYAGLTGQLLAVSAGPWGGAASLGWNMWWRGERGVGQDNGVVHHLGPGIGEVLTNPSLSFMSNLTARLVSSVSVLRAKKRAWDCRLCGGCEHRHIWGKNTAMAAFNSTGWNKCCRSKWAIKK